LFSFLARVQFARQIPEVLASVKKVDDLNGSGEVLVGDIPDPFGPVSEDYLGFGAFPAAIPGFEVTPGAELARRFNGGDISSRVRIADGVPVFVPRSLGENGTDFHLAGVSRLSVNLAGPAFGFSLYDRYSGSIHFYVEYRDRLTHNDRQTQLPGSLNFLPVTLRDVGPDSLGRTFHRFGRHMEASQQFELLPAVVKRSFTAHSGEHAAHAGRVVSLLNVEQDIGRALSVMTFRTKIPGARERHLSDGG
jgi:hypothetical protein